MSVLIEKKKIENILCKLLFANYFAYQFFLVLSDSVVSMEVPLFHNLTNYCIKTSFLLIILINVVKVLLGKFDIKEIIICFVFGVLFFYSYFKCRDGMALLNLFYICAFKDIDYKKVFRVYFISTMSAVILLSFIGLFTNYTNSIESYRMGMIRLRHSMGFVSRPTSNYYVFVATIALMITIKKNVLKWSIVLYLINVFYFVMTLTRSAFLYINIFFAIFLILRLSRSLVVRKILTYITLLSYIALPIFVYNISIMYDDQNALFNFLNKILSGRLSLTQNALINRKLELFGSSIVTEIAVTGRAFVDSAFIQYIINKGLIVFIVLIVFYLVYIFILDKTNEHFIVLSLLIVALMSSFDVGFIALQFSPFQIPFLFILNKCLNKNE